MALQFSADGRYLVAGCCDTGASWVQVFDLWDDGRCVVDINAHTKAVYAVAFAPYNPARLLSCSSDHSAKVWECKALQSAEPAPRTLDRGFSFLTREESTGSGTGLRRVPPLPEPQPFEADEEYMCVTALIHTSPVYCAVFHPTAEAVLTGSLDRSIRIWSIATGAPVAVLCTSDSWVSSLAIAADASTLYSAHGDGRITVWGAETEPPSLSRPSTRHADAAVTSFGFTILRTLTDFWAAGVSQVLLCPSERLLLVHCRADNTVAAVAVGTWEIVQRYHVGGPGGHPGRCGVSADGGTLVASGDDGRLHVWDVGTGKPLCPPEGLAYGHCTPVYCVAWSPTEHAMALATYGAGPNMITVWARERRDAEVVLERTPWRRTSAPGSAAGDTLRSPLARSVSVVAPALLSPMPSPLAADTPSALSGADGESPTRGHADRLQQIVDKWRQTVSVREVKMARSLSRVRRAAAVVDALRQSFPGSDSGVAVLPHTPGAASTADGARGLRADPAAPPGSVTSARPEGDQGPTT